MTTEIAIMNKTAVALAADSAVTIGHISSQGQEQKVYNSANKLFALSKFAPVGIMVFGNATLMGIPWETIIKTYRVHLGNNTYPFLKDYCEHFFTFLDNFSVDTKVGERYVLEISSLVFREIRQQLNEFVEKNTKEGKIVLEKDILFTLKNIIQEKFSEFKKISESSVFTKIEKNKLKKKYSHIFENSVSCVFEKIPFSRTDKLKLFDIAINAITTGPANQSGVVIAGFGEKEIFPACHDFDVRAILESHTIKTKRKDHCISQDSTVAIIPFAQSNEVCTFMEGMGRNIDEFFKKAFHSMMVHDFPIKLSDALVEKLKINDLDIKSSIIKIIQEMGHGAVSEIQRNLQLIKEKYYIHPVVQATGFLNKAELAAMAETLVNLVSFKKQVTLEAETVGGPIDVAVISKGDGFVWIKRKHYFDPSLNHHFFNNYFSGGVVNEKG